MPLPITFETHSFHFYMQDALLTTFKSTLNTNLSYLTPNTLCQPNEQAVKEELRGKKNFQEGSKRKELSWRRCQGGAVKDKLSVKSCQWKAVTERLAGNNMSSSPSGCCAVQWAMWKGGGLTSRDRLNRSENYLLLGFLLAMPSQTLLLLVRQSVT